MRRIVRAALGQKSADALARRQGAVDQARAAGPIDATTIWKNARQSTEVLDALATLTHMAGDHQCCMYCEHSHGTDIEHFWPKATYPEHLFVWPNLLLCCTECGRLKGKRLPLDNGLPLLVDPTAEDPWHFLDFEPDTGHLTARFETTTNRPSPKGTATVALLHLDRREALARLYSRTYRRLCAAIEEALAPSRVDAAALIAKVRALDDHGLLAWCFSDRGRKQSPFLDLHRDHRAAWDECAKQFA